MGLRLRDMRIRTQVRPLLRALRRGDAIAKDLHVGTITAEGDMILLGDNVCDQFICTGPGTVKCGSTLTCGENLTLDGQSDTGWVIS